MEFNEIDFNIYMAKAFDIKDKDVCWCGSGEKFIDCHKRIGSAKKAHRGEIENAYRILFRKKMCLHPRKSECYGQVIDAHSIQNSKSIGSISVNGHVYIFNIGFDELENYIQYQTLLPKKIGVNVVSTFKGFCSYHDRTLFLKIDTEKISPTLEQSLLLAIRSMAKEIYVKTINSNNETAIHTIQKGQDVEIQARIEEMLKLNAKGSEIAVRDLYYHYNRLFEMIHSKSYKNFHRLVIKIDTIPEIMCSSVIHPVIDLNGNILQTLKPGKNIFDVISIEILSNGNDGIIQFCWHDNSTPCEKFIDSILHQDDKPNTIIKLVFSLVENHAFSIKWWDNLSIIKRKKIMKYVASNIYQGTLDMKELVMDYRKYVNWNIIEIKKE
jgi:hypothetical protein